jgi:hypothetical protein
MDEVVDVRLREAPVSYSAEVPPRDWLRLLLSTPLSTHTVTEMTLPFGQSSSRTIALPPISLVPTDEFRRLTHVYRVSDPFRVQGFIQRNSIPASLLFDAYEQASAIFGSAGRSYSLEVTQDPEEGNEVLFAVIGTALEPARALELLDRLDEQWFLESVPADIAALFAVTVERL